MMIMMAPEATAQDIAYVVARLETTGTVHAKVVPGRHQVAIAALAGRRSAVGRPDADQDLGHEFIKG
jgi:hypothetical protein